MSDRWFYYPVAVAIAFLVLLSVLGKSDAQVIMTQPTGLPQSQISQGNGSIASLTTSTTLTFAHPITRLMIWTAPSSSTLYVNLTGAAADNTCAPVFGGASLSFPFSQPIDHITLYAGSSASGTYGYAAN